MFTQDYSTPTFPKVEEKADVFAWSNLIAWLEKQPSDRPYEFFCQLCLLGNYFRQAGFKIEYIGDGSYQTPDGNFNFLPPGWNLVAKQEPHTYGAALTRARAWAGRK